MEYDAGSYVKLQVKQFPARSIRETAEGKYWKQFKAPVFAKQVRQPWQPFECVALNRVSRLVVALSVACTGTK